jgi:hypothetical protein
VLEKADDVTGDITLDLIIWSAHKKLCDPSGSRAVA